MRIAFIFWIAIGCGVLAKAQPTAPTFQCLAGDTLTWLDPIDACGPLQNITIFGAATTSGPYTQLTTVAAGIEEYLLTLQETAAYDAFYLTATYGCSPAVSGTSDTLTTDALGLTRIFDIIYDVNGTTLIWRPADDPRVTMYQVYKETDMGTELIAEVADTFYMDGLTQTDGSSSIYYLGTVDDCNRTSFNSEQYSSLFIGVERDGCAGEVNIDPQLAAPYPVDFVEAIVTRRTFRGSLDTLRLPVVAGTLTVPDLPSDTAYTIRLTLVDEEGGRNTSFPVDLGPQRLVADDVIEVVQLTYEGSTWALRWRWNPRAQYENIRYEVRSGNRVVVEGMGDPAFQDLSAPIVDLGLDASFDWSDAVATVTATDVCGATRTSAPASPGVVTARELGPTLVDVQWTLPQAATITLNSWDLRLLSDVGSQLLLTTDEVQEFVHDVSAVNVREVCYQTVTDVTAPAVFERSAATYTWRSAPGCALRQPRVYIPTGFVPEGFTIGFRPRLSLTEGLSYRFRIYDRWGGQLFETDDRFATWDGREGGRLAPTGVYLAVVELEEPGRDVIRVESMFAVVR